MNHAFGALRLIAVAAGALFGLVVQAQTPGSAKDIVPSAPTTSSTTRAVTDASGAVITLPMARAVLNGHAVLPYDTTHPAPSDAGPEFGSSGKHALSETLPAEPAGARRVNAPLSASSAPRPTGAALPFKGQIVQGVVSVVPLQRDEYLVLSDNGFETRPSSQDVLLAVHRMRPDWATGRIVRRESLFLKDPDRVLPFPIQNASTRSRLLTGADLSPRSIQIVGKEMWVGDDYGPYIVRFDIKGKALGLIETTLRSHTYRSAEHHVFTAGGGIAETSAEVAPGGGLKAMAQSIDGSRLYPILSKPLFDPATREPERSKGKPVVRILEIDTQSRSYTGRHLKYVLDSVDHVVADFKMLSATTGLVLERDDASEGDEPSCPGLERADCFTQPARFKRLVKIDLSKLGPDRVVRKVAYVDLTQIENPKALAKAGPNGATFTLPHRSPSALAVVNDTHVVVVNDHNAPFGSSREIGKPDDTEFTLLDLTDLIEIQ